MMKQHIEEIHTAIRTGTHVTKKYIEDNYPEYKRADVNNMLQRLKKMYGIETALDNGKLRLFWRYATE